MMINYRDRLLVSLMSIRGELCVMQRTDVDPEVASFLMHLDGALSVILRQPHVTIPAEVLVEAELAEHRVKEMVTYAINRRLR